VSALLITATMSSRQRTRLILADLTSAGSRWRSVRHAALRSTQRRSPECDSKFLELPSESLLRDLVFRICGLAMTMLGIVPIYDVFNCLSLLPIARRTGLETSRRAHKILLTRPSITRFKRDCDILAPSRHWHLLPRLLFSVFFSYIAYSWS